MKLFNKILMGIATCVALVETTSQAQIDFFGQPRTIYIIQSPSSGIFTNISATVTYTAFTNIVNVAGYDGIAKIDFVVSSNAPSATTTTLDTLTNTLYSSFDKTNWTLVPNVAIATQTSVTYSNNVNGSIIYTTNVYSLPGTVSTVATGTAGYAPPNSALALLTPAPFTNNAVVVQSGGGTTEIGFVIQDVQRYLMLVTSVGGSNAVYGAQAILTGRRQY